MTIIPMVPPTHLQHFYLLHRSMAQIPAYVECSNISTVPTPQLI